MSQERGKFHWSDLIPERFSRIKQAARVGQLRETIATLKSTEDVLDELRAITDGIGLLVADYAAGVSVSPEGKTIESLQARLELLYTKREHFAPTVRQQITEGITLGYANLQKIDPRIKPSIH